MKINIWSDVRCPFCFVGKKKFEKALEKFPHSEKLEITWHSFQLDPQLITQPDVNPYEYFAKAKGITLERAKAMHEGAAMAGKEAGIDFNFDDSKVANSYKAHLLIQLSKTKNLANEMEEALFEAQFLDGKNIDDEETLIQLAKSIGITEDEAKNALQSDELGYLVKQDMQLAAQLGINAVPFFVINDKYGISGAQQPELFLEALEKTWEEFSSGDKSLQLINSGDSCDIDGNCN
ncbi:DsbA family protein [Cloacibacterium normanense]|uniref:DsbA family oxidoreductase n=1 Tax=Cloacibacterium normanense TaxID=237258 RepID=UPI0035AEDB54